MYIALNLKGVETVHSSEPIYNRLHDRWDSICKVQVPKGTLKLIGIDSKVVASYSSNISIIDSTNKINF